MVGCDGAESACQPDWAAVDAELVEADAEAFRREAMNAGPTTDSAPIAGVPSANIPGTAGGGGRGEGDDGGLSPTPVDLASHPESGADASVLGQGDVGTSYGDVHLHTPDGRHYNFQAVGEFIMSKSQDGFDVQLRLEPWIYSASHSWASTSVSTNTAAAVNISGDRVGIYARGGGPNLLVNGHPTSLESGTIRLPHVGRSGNLVSVSMC